MSIFDKFNGQFIDNLPDIIMKFSKSEILSKDLCGDNEDIRQFENNNPDEEKCENFNELKRNYMDSIEKIFSDNALNSYVMKLLKN